MWNFVLDNPTNEGGGIAQVLARTRGVNGAGNIIRKSHKFNQFRYSCVHTNLAH